MLHFIIVTRLRFGHCTSASARHHIGFFSRIYDNLQIGVRMIFFSIAYISVRVILLPSYDTPDFWVIN
jgi:hypothetical protein